MMSPRVKLLRRGFIALAFLISFLPARIDADPTAALKQVYDPIIQTHARKLKVPADLIHSIIRAESNYDSRAISPKGAVGLMQLMPETATQYGVRDRFDPEDNIRGGVKYLQDLIKLYGGKTKLILAAYNAGQEALKKFSGIPPYPETRKYIQQVMKSYPRTYVSGSLPIYKFVNSSGTTVFTNDPHCVRNSRRNGD